MAIPIIGKFYRFLNTTQKRINFIYGGASSGKSHSMGQYFVKKFFDEERGKQFLVVRKTSPSLRITAYKLIIDLIKEYNLPMHLNKSEMLLTFNGNEMRFKSLDDPEKMKSYNVNYIWAEELTEFTIKDFRRLIMNLRAKNDKPNQLFGTFNPIDAYHWINTKFLSTQDDRVAVCHSTYMDNPFNTQEYINDLQSLEKEDAEYFRVYAQGKWGIRKNIIYKNWEIIPFREFPSYDNCDFVIYGMDFGFNNPSAITEIRFKDSIIFERQLLYEKGLTNPQLIEKAKELILDRSAIIYADGAEPARIKEFKRDFQNIKKADKGSGSVSIGLDFVKRHKQYIANDSLDLINEKRAYKYKEDSNENVLEDPVKWQDHLMDAERMAIYTHLVKMGVKKGGVYFRNLGKKRQAPEGKEEESKEESAFQKTEPIEELKENKPVILTPRTNKLARRGGVFFRNK